MQTKWRRLFTYGGKVAIVGLLVITLFTPLIALLPSSINLIAEAAWIPIGEDCPEGTIQEVPINSTQKECVGSGGTDATEAGDSFCNSPASCIANVVYIFTVGLGTAVAYVGAWVFNLATVLTLNSTAYALTFLSEGWSIVRDIANMFFILILVYIALTVMFRADTSETMKRLAWVIAIALVINFSFFFVRVVIDAGNLMAVQFYNAIPAQPLTATQEQGGLSGVAASASAALGRGGDTKDLTSTIMNGVGAQTILSLDSFKEFKDKNNFFSELIALTFIYIALGAILFILAAAFFTVGIKFIVRTAVLWLVLIAAPLALIARTVKQGEKYYTKWQDALIMHAFYPAVFLFIFYILTLFMGELTRGGAIVAQTFDNLNTVQTGGLVYIVPLIAIVGIKLGFVIALLYIGLRASEAMGVAGAGLARNITGKAFGAGFATLGFAGRNTLGWGGRRLADSRIVSGFAARGGILGRSLWRGVGAVGRSSFDVRGAPGTKAGLSLATGVDVGVAGGKGGYSAAFDARVARREREAAALAPTRRALEQAEENAINQLERQQGGFRNRLAQAVSNFRDAREEREQVGDPASQARFRTARQDLTALVRQINTIARPAAGVENANTFAASISTASWRNLWGITGHPGLPIPYISRADREAAARIRNPQNDADRLRNVLGNLGITTLPPPQQPPPAPPPGGPPPGPAPLARTVTRRDRSGRPTRTQPIQSTGTLSDATARLVGAEQERISTQQQMTSSTPTQPTQRAGNLSQFGDLAEHSDTSRAFEYKPGMTEEQYNKGVAELNKTIAEQGKLTREAILKGSHESSSASKETLKVGGERLGEIVRELKKSERKAEERGRTQIEEMRAGSAAVEHKLDENTERGGPATAKEVAKEVGKTINESGQPISQPTTPTQPPKPEDKK